MDLMISSATHRSGSTLLQRIFNARKETLIWGENGGCLTDFCKMHENAKYYSRNSKPYRNAYFKGGEDPNNWIAFMTPAKPDVDHALIQSVKTFHHLMYADQYQSTHDIIGYKEVRYGKNELNLLRQCYPDCTILLLVRNPVDVWSSISANAKIKQYGSVHQFTSIWNQRVKDYLQLSNEDQHMHLIKYEDIVTKDEAAINLIKKVGHLKNEQIESVLTKKISSSSRSIPKNQRNQILRQCRAMMQKMGYGDE